MHRASYFAILSAALLAPAAAFAQAPPKPQTPVAPMTEQLDSKACAQNRATVGQGGDVVVRTPPGTTLSDKLASSDGVICPPPHVDPEIKAPTPPGGPMPVIPPPGSPGGDPTVQPK